MQWYPGHIARAEKLLREQLKAVDAVVEVRDIRIPLATTHPDIPDWIGSKLRVLVLNRADMVSDSERSKWVSWFKRNGETHVVLTDARSGKGVKRVAEVALLVSEQVNEKRVAKGLMPRAVRTAVIDAVRSLPIETDLTDRKEELKRSGLGRMIMFLSGLPEETPANRKKCKDLVEKWSRPVYELSSQYRDLRQEVEVEEDRPKKKKRKNAVAGGTATEDQDLTAKTRDGPKYGESGYRYHAVVPEPESLDYKVRPKLTIDPAEIKARTQNADQQRVRKLVGKVAKKKGIRDAKAYLPSVEGRGMVTYN